MLLAAPLLAADVQDPSAPQRSSAARGVEGLTPALDRALVSILTVEAELERLTRPEDELGEPITDAGIYEQVLFGEGSAFLAYMQPALERFDLRGEALPSMRFGVDLVRFDSGFRAAAALLEAADDFEIASVLDLFSDRFVAAEPIWGTPQSREYHRSTLRVGQLAPLGNGGALGYLAWGLLRQDSYWESEAHDREAFILELLSRGFDSRLVARTVARTLTPPMLVPRKALAQARPGRGIAGPMLSLRGKVGFGRVHEQRLVADLATLAALEDSESHDPALDLRDKLRTIDEAGHVTTTLNQRGHLRTWLPEMLALVRQELYPAGAAAWIRHGETLVERLTYWKQLFTQFGFIEGRDRFLREVEAILAGADAHPLSARIEQLLAMQTPGGLSPDQADELLDLQKKRDKDRDELILEVTGMMVWSGLDSHYELLVQTMLEDFPSALGAMPAHHQEKFLDNGWRIMTAMPQPKTMTTLADHLSGELPLESFTVEYLISGLTIHSYPGSEALLSDLVEAGSLVNVSRAITNPAWISDDGFDRAAARLIEGIADPDGDSAVLRMAAGLLAGLSRREDQSRVKAILVKTFEGGLWEDSKGPWPRYFEEREKRWVRSLFSAKELDEFEAAGKLPAGFF